MVKTAIAFFCGCWFSAVLIACAAPNFFNYHDYALWPDGHKLLGPTEKDDLDVSVCNGDEKQKIKCRVFLNEEYLKVKKDYNGCMIKLISCQGKAQP